MSQSPATGGGGGGGGTLRQPDMRDFLAELEAEELAFRDNLDAEFFNAAAPRAPAGGETPALGRKTAAAPAAAPAADRLRLRRGLPVETEHRPAPAAGRSANTAKSPASAVPSAPSVPVPKASVPLKRSTPPKRERQAAAAAPRGGAAPASAPRRRPGGPGGSGASAARSLSYKRERGSKAGAPGRGSAGEKHGKGGLRSATRSEGGLVARRAEPGNFAAPEEPATRGGGLFFVTDRDNFAWDSPQAKDAEGKSGEGDAADDLDVPLEEYEGMDSSDVNIKQLLEAAESMEESILNSSADIDKDATQARRLRGSYERVSARYDAVSSKRTDILKNLRGLCDMLGSMESDLDAEDREQLPSAAAAIAKRLPVDTKKVASGRESRGGGGDEKTSRDESRRRAADVMRSMEKMAEAAAEMEWKRMEEARQAEEG